METLTKLQRGSFTPHLEGQGKASFKILTFTPVWRRPEVFEICLAGIKRLQQYAPERFKILPFFIVSEPEAAAQCERFGFDFIFHKNQPLGAKKNAGLKHVMENYDFDYLMELGSDDLVTNDYLDYIEPYMAAGVGQFVPRDVYFIDIRTGQTAHWRTDKILGAGRCISRGALELFAPGYKLWIPTKERGMDTCSWLNLMSKAVFVKLLPTERVYTLDIKSDTNINSLAPFIPSSMLPEQLLGYFPEGHMVMELIENSTGLSEDEQHKNNEVCELIEFLKN